ncbi:MAG TPA: ABC transporter ATP-binding protein [Candidatus Angelobacter sp.]|nr:ABC transporter ATP-binding protein [Candidatus Angelobacter sp.]
MKTPARPQSALLEVREVSKSFGTLRAVDGVSFHVNAGECLALLGPNGAGKTTTLSIVTGLITPDRGEVLIEGRRLAGDTDAIKSRMGLVPQELALFEDLSASDNLRFFGALYNLEAVTLKQRMAAALDLVGLGDRGQDKVKTFSGGMKRRLNLACALLHDPQLLLLDEPTVGVDPQSRNAIFDNIAALRARGKTVLYTTHYMEEVERLCDRVVIIDSGKVIADDTVTGLKNRATRACHLKIELANPDGATWLDELKTLAGVRSAGLNANELVVALDELATSAPTVLSFLTQRRQAFVHLQSERPNLESVFLELTGHNLRDK